MARFTRFCAARAVAAGALAAAADAARATPEDGAQGDPLAQNPPRAPEPKNYNQNRPKADDAGASTMISLASNALAARKCE